MKKYRCILATLLALFGFINAGAAELTVNVSPTNPILPPQVMYYLSNPGQYFNMSVTNTSMEIQRFYVGLELRQITPTGDIDIVVPGKTMPRTPFEVAPSGVKVFNAAEMRNMFNHVRAEDIVMPSYLFDNALSGQFGNLPEGNYQMFISLYKWDPTLSSEVLLNNPAISMCQFTVCYSAQPPIWTSPMPLGDFEDRNICTLSKQAPILQWLAPAVACNVGIQNYLYDVKIVQQIPLQEINEAIERNAVVYQVNGLTMPQCMIPINYINQMSPHENYVAQITARTNASQEGSIGYINVQNGGKSDLRVFRIKDYAEMPVDTVPADSLPSNDENNDSIWGFGFGHDENVTDSLYNFRNPEILLPVYNEKDGARKEFMGSDIAVLWRKPWFEGGKGERPDTIKFKYDVELYASDEYLAREEMYKLNPVYENRGISEVKDTIKWNDIKDQVKKGSYMLLHIKPIVVNEKSVAFLNDSINTIDFGLCEHSSKKYFKCTNQVEIKNEIATKLKAKDLKGKVVTIGEYELTLDEIKDEKEEGCFTGTGHVKWEPLGLTCQVAVKFEKIYINTDNQVYKGLVEGCAGTSETSLDIVKDLFSDWGIDNWVSDLELPYSKELQKQANKQVQNLAQRIDISKYYREVKLGQNIYDGLFKGKVNDLRLPISIPKSINQSPVDIQIATMTFAPTYATMDIIGEFQLPKSDYVKNEILVFGAPRLCISPKRFLPESGAVSLLADFTLKDPDSGYDFTFKAPKDVLAPEDGCFISWAADSLELLEADIEMSLPNLKKVENGKATDKKPKLYLHASISDWNDWFADGGMDPFEAEDLEGYTFTAQNLVYDHSLVRNSNKMGSFPEDYDKTKAGIQGKGGEVAWQGIYIDEVSIEFPKAIKVGNGKERMKAMARNMFFDNSGCTLEAGIVNLINYKKDIGGKIGSFSFSLDNVCVNIIQNNFKGTYFDGKMDIPLLDGSIGYRCDIYNQKFVQSLDGDKTKYSYDPSKSGFAYVFKVQQIDKLNFDFFLAELQVDKNLTYFLLDAVDQENGDIKTNIEFCLGGKINIGEGAIGEEILGSLPIKPHIPNITFTKMRIANNPSFEAYDAKGKQMQIARDKALAQLDGEINKWSQDTLLTFGDGEDKIYFNIGEWGYASPQKRLGIFEFSITEFAFAKGVDGKNPWIGLTIGGGVALCKGLDLSADAAFTIKANVKNLSDLSKLELEYGGCEFDSAHVNFEVPAFALKGTLYAGRHQGNISEDGYGGSLEANICYGLFELKIDGGYYRHKEEGNNFAWGYFKASTGGKFGVPMGPIKLTRVSAGFYFNCKVNPESEDRPTAANGVIGITGGIGLATTDGELVSGDLDFTVVWDKNKKRLTSFLFTGKVKAVGGVVNAKATLVYLHDDLNKYLKINVTADIKADGLASDVLDDINKGVSKLKEFNSKAEDIVSDVKGGLKESMKDESNDSPASSKTKKELDKIASDTGTTEKDAQDENGQNIPTAGATVSLEIQITSMRDGKKCEKWHVYLGEPSHDKRCKFTLIDFSSKVISVSIGASAYLCVGNELPDNGVLPPLPKRVAQFLDGSTKGSGVKSDTKADADAARQDALSGFNSEIDGGVMLGAHVWGGIDINLGLFYGKAGADAGFDISVVHLKPGSNCINLKGRVPGYKGWYGRGQLYAYLYAAFGLNIDLGFFHKKISIIDCGIGGVFKAALPSPNYFYGKARCKLKLLGGLVNLDKTFKFNCGQKCDLFAGNALDDYPLFDHISIGKESWDEIGSERLSATIDFSFNPYIVTASPMNQAVYVIDPTSQKKVEEDRNLHGEALTLASTRKFKFAPVSFKLYEYDNLSQAKKEETDTLHRKLCKVYDIDYEFSDTKVVLSMPKLKGNKYYEIQAKGKALEMIDNRWRNPEKWDSIRGKYIETPWSCTKSFYFATNADEFNFKDNEDLQKFVRLAYPCKLTEDKALIKCKNGSDYVYCIHEDLDNPLIMLNTNVQALPNVYKEGKLTWHRYNMGDEIYTADNQFKSMGDSLFYMMPKTWKDVKTNKYVSTTPANYVEKLVLKYTVTRNAGTSTNWSVVRSFKTSGYKKDLESKYKNMYSGSFYKVEVTEFETLKDTHDTEYEEYETAATKIGGRSLRKTSQLNTDNEIKTYYINIYKKSIKTNFVTESTNLLELNLYDVSKYGWAKDNWYDNTSSVYNDYVKYLKPFIGIKLGKVMYNYTSAGNMSDRGGVTNSLYSLYTEYGTNSAGYRLAGGGFAGKFETLGGLKSVVYDPFTYFSWLANVGFISSAKVSSASNKLNFSYESTRALQLEMPWASGPVVTKYSPYTKGGLMFTAIDFEKACYYPTATTSKGASAIMWPLRANEAYKYVMGSSLQIGANNIAPDLGKTNPAMTFINYFCGNYKMAEDLSDKISSDIGLYCSTVTSLKSGRDYIHSYGRLGNYITASNYKFGLYVKVPFYQVPLAWTGTQLPGTANVSLNRTIDSNDTHWRFSDTGGEKTQMTSKIFLSMCNFRSTAKDNAIYKNVERVKFEGQKALDQVYSIKFTMFRINGYNVKTNSWTVVNIPGRTTVNTKNITVKGLQINGTPKTVTIN